MKINKYIFKVILFSFISSLYANEVYENILTSLNKGAEAKNFQEYELSIEYLDKAERIFINFNKFDISQKTEDFITNMFLSGANAPYKGMIYEGVMINTYKAINYMLLNDNSNARIEFNRALDRQRRAIDYFEQEINDHNNEISKNEDFMKILGNSETQKEINKIYSSLDQFKINKDFSNPYPTYLAGIFFGLIKDKTKSVDLLKEAYGMTNNDNVLSDLKLFQKGNKVEDYAWVIFENGLSPTKKQFRISVPIPTFTGEMYHVGMAYPLLEKGQNAFDKITVISEKNTVFSSELVNMNNILATEYKKKLPLIKDKAIMSALAKGGIQYAANKIGGFGLGTVASLYSALTTRADTRLWTDISNSYHICRVKLDKNKKLSIKTKEDLIDIEISKDSKNAIVFVKIYEDLDEPIINVVEI